MRRRLQLRWLVVVVPGIGGSILRADDGTVLWDGSVGCAVKRLFNAHDLRLCDGVPDDGVRAVGVIPTTAVGPFWTAIHGYDRLVRGIRANFDAGGGDVAVDWGDPARRDLLADIVMVPYDFRRSVSIAAAHLAEEVEMRQAARRAAGRPTAAVVVAHSMGGLVAMHWIAHLGGHERCQRLITLGTPFRGAPKALDVLANGIDAKLCRLTGPVPVLATWPSMHELLPRWRMVEGQGPGENTLIWPHEQKIVGVDANLGDAALESLESTDAAWRRLADAGSLPSVRALLGYGHRTLQGAFADGGGKVRVVNERPEALDFSDLDGDGTVPWSSAAPAGMELADAFAVGTRHGAFASGADAVLELRLLAQPDFEGDRGGDDGAPMLGVAVDEVVVGPAPVSVRAELRVDRHVVAPEPGLLGRVWHRRVQDGPAGGTGPWEVVPMKLTDGGWEAELASLAPGLHEIEVAVTGASYRSPDPVRELVLVLDPRTVSP